MSNEADTCRKYILPKLYAAGWNDDQISEQKTFTDGRIVVVGKKVSRKPQKRADYLLRYKPDFMIAVVEAKASYMTPGAGLQQAMDYAQILGLKFAYATNGKGIVEHDFLTGEETELTEFPSPVELWRRLKAAQGINEDVGDKLLTPYYHLSGKSPRYYQEIAINRAVKAILQGKKRVLLTLATGTGKTVIAFQICWKLWSSRWNSKGQHRKPKILFLADRTVLIDDPKDKTFAPFGDARWKIEGEAIKSRDIYFSTYQAIAKDERRPGLYLDYPPDFFDLIIVDECHRGSARDDSNWREILEYFYPAYQLGMTATPLRKDNIDTYRYFGNPLYIYSLRQGIEDGFLAPYKVHRVATTVDVTGWRPSKGEVDRYGREIPDELYGTKDFERIIAMRARTEAIARHLTDYLKKTDRFAKTIVFCVDQEHAEEMRKALVNLNSDIVKDYPDYVCRVVSDEGQIGRGHLSRFQELETLTPAILTTSQMLTTGVDAPTCKNVVLVRVINSMTEFKQIIGRGTRVRDDYGKLYFTILDYTGSATRLFADPEFDGDPTFISEEQIDDDGNTIEYEEKTDDVYTDTFGEDDPGYGDEEETEPPNVDGDHEGRERMKYYVDGGTVEIAADMVYELDADGKQLRVVKFTDYTADKVRSMFTSVEELRSRWSTPEERAIVIQALAEKGISIEQLESVMKRPDSDPFDLLCHLAYNAPLKTRRERAEMIKKGKEDFFEKYAPQARQVLQDILDKYVEYGPEQLTERILKVPPISERGNIREIISYFGGKPEKLKQALVELQSLIYAA